MSSASLQPYLEQFLRSSDGGIEPAEGLPPTLDPLHRRQGDDRVNACGDAGAHDEVT
jgi:hypothetical protein